MSPAGRSAVDAAQGIADALEGAGMSYAIGGALALAIAGVPRGTADVNVFVPRAHVHEVITVLSRLGIEFTAAAEQARREGMFVGRWDGMRIDSVFKLLFSRGKDLVDLERLVAVRPELDTAYVRRWIVDMRGDDTIAPGAGTKSSGVTVRRREHLVRGSTRPRHRYGISGSIRPAARRAAHASGAGSRARVR